MEVEIIPVGDVADAVLNEAVEVLARTCGTNATISDRVSHSETPLQPANNPYDAEKLLSFATSQAADCITVLITRLPLTHDEQEFVFGVAEKSGEACVVSTYKLYNSYTGDGYTDPGTALDRVRKEVVHEFGHVLGQSHCQNSGCVMNFSMEVKNIDTKPETFCESCQSDLNDITN